MAPTLSQRAVRGLARLVSRVFFYEVEVVGTDELPPRGPLIVVANHPNGLLDPALMLTLLPRLPYFLAKHTLFRNPLVRPLLALAGAIPVFRSKDRAGGVARANEDAFARCHEKLSEGGVIAIYPEGVTHDEAMLQPLKSGAARIALGAESRFGPLDLRVVPVGLTFDRKARFRSRALMLIGSPMDVPRLGGASSGEAARQLTERIREALRHVALDAESWHEARRAEMAASLMAEGSGDLPGFAPLSDRITLRQQLHVARRSGLERSPEVLETESRVDRYIERLRTLGLRDDHLTARYPSGAIARRSMTTLGVMLLLLVPALLGVVLNYLPYRACGPIADRFANQRPMVGTLKVMSALVLLPLTWFVEAALAWRYLGAEVAAAVLLLAPSSGYLALLFFDRVVRLRRELRAWRTRLRHPEQVDALRTERDALAARLRELLARPNVA